MKLATARQPSVAGFGNLSILSAIASLALIYFYIVPEFTVNESIPVISQSLFEKGLFQCELLKRPINPPQSNRDYNPRVQVKSDFDQSTERAIVNAHLIDGDGSDHGIQHILIKNGVIYKITRNISEIITENKYDANRSFVTPGLVDCHSHAGTDQWPAYEATDDTNEMAANPVVPFMRVIDGFSPHDAALRIINTGGVTSSLILPGSGNLMGGEAFPIKLRRVKSNQISEWRLDFGHNETVDGFQFRYMKMACGENAKRAYGDKGMMPESRLGEGALFRREFQKAKSLMEDQNEWCELASNAIEEHGQDRAHRYINRQLPMDLEVEPLSALLRGHVRLQNHCYETHDLEMMIRHSKEFGYKITAFHHALEAWQVASLVSKENISVALFADHWGYKKEAYGTSVKAAQVLSNSKVPVSFKSDHPVLNAQNLLFEAQKAHYYGLDAKLAIQSVTSVPAKIMGQDYRIGYIRQGYDADLVVWDRHPLELGANPRLVLVDGFQTWSRKDLIVSENTNSYVASNSKVDNCKPDHQGLVISNVAKVYMDETTILENVKIVIGSNGKIDCVGRKCRYPSSWLVLDSQNSTVSPGLIAGYTHLGLEEIAAEQVTSNGYQSDQKLDSLIFAADGLHLGIEESKELTAAHNAGVLTSVSVPRGSGVLLGRPVAFKTGNKLPEAVINSNIGLAARVGNAAKNSATPTISSQYAKLKSLFTDKILSNGQTLFIEANSENDIVKIIQLKKEYEFNRNNTISITIVGGAEAWTVAEDLADAKIGILLRPARCVPSTFETRKCILPGAVGSGIEFMDYQKTGLKASLPAAQILLRAGVNVGLSVDEDNFVRGLRWEAGWVWSTSKSLSISKPLTTSEALGIITWNVADLFGLDTGRIKIGSLALFNVFSSDPISGVGNSGGLSSYLKLIVNGNKVTCDPRQI